MKNFYLFILLFSTVAFSQNTIRIQYGVQFEGEFGNPEQKKNIKSTPSLDGIEGYMAKYSFELFYKDGISVYKGIPQMASDNEGTSESIAKIFISYYDVYYRNIKQKTLIRNHALDGVHYNITDHYDAVDWILSTETKIISGFTCYKATGKIRNRIVEAVAWYCPQIPCNVGPNAYGNLPGLILELNQGRLKYLAVAIDLKADDKNIIELPAGKNVSLAEYEIIYEKRSSNAQQQF